MKLFQKTSVAVALTIIMISAAIGIGQWRAASADPVEETAQSTRLDSSLSHGGLHQVDRRPGKRTHRPAGGTDLSLQRQLGQAV